MLFRGRWSGGKKAGKARRGFCFRLGEAVEASLHCGRAGSVILLRKPLTKMTANTISQHIQFTRVHLPPVHLSLRPLCASNGENAALLAHVFFNLPLQTMIDG